MNGHKGPNQTIVVSPKSVVLRQSTDFLAVTTSHVLKVLEYMRTHFSSGITVEELARQVPISRSVLYRLFIEEVGHSMVEETKLRIGEISKQSGFNGNISFSRAFQSATGESPSEYRAKYSPICHDSTILPRGES